MECKNLSVVRPHSFCSLWTMAVPPPPTGHALSLVSALSNTQNHTLHVQAIRARDDALSASPDSYNHLCLQLVCILLGSDQPAQMIQSIDPVDLETWRQTDTESILRLQQDESLWVQFGQMSGLILKNALLRPPISVDHRAFVLRPPAADAVKDILLQALSCEHAELRAVASSILAASAVSNDGVQPALHLSAWPALIPTLVHNLRSSNSSAVEGSLVTVKKIMEDGPSELGEEDLDNLIPALVHYLPVDNEKYRILVLQSLIACVASGLMPTALVVHFPTYLSALSALATHPSSKVKKLVCRSIVTLLELRPEYIRAHLAALCQFMLQSSSDRAHLDVALEACEFWLTFAHLDDEACTPDMLETVGATVPQLIPVLLQNMVFQPDQQAAILAQNELELQDIPGDSTSFKPIFHRSRAKHVDVANDSDSGYDEDGEADGYDDDDDDGGNEWSLRKCAAASLDSLANLYGADLILPYLLPELDKGLRDSDPWVQEASILALGAISEGCALEMSTSMSQLHPFLMSHLLRPETREFLPQVKSISAWTLGRYASWAVEQVQMGAQGHLLAQMTEVFMTRLGDRNRRVQVACCSAFGVIVEVAGDLMAPYLEQVYKTLVSAMSRYKGRSLLMIFDVMGLMADCCGSAIAEGGLPAIYVPPLLRMWDGLAKNDPSDRTLLPLMESLASIAVTSGMNFQPYAMVSFESAMRIIEGATLLLATSGETIENEEDTDPIVCATDLLDGLVEGMGGNFPALISGSHRYGPHFLNVLVSMCKHEISSVRMSALALLGDLARNAPALLEPALPQLLHEAVENMNPIHPSVCTNAVWAVGEICLRCQGNDAPLRPFAVAMMQNLIAILMGNGVGSHGRGTDIPGLAENAAACIGRLAKANTDFVAPELSRFLLGWCDGMAKITDPTERHDAFDGFIRTVYANPNAIQQATSNIAEAIASILFCIVTWHMPAELPAQTTVLLNGDYNFRQFPPQEAELGASLVRFVQDMKVSVGEETWVSVQRELPVNVKRLLRETYSI